MRRQFHIHGWLIYLTVTFVLLGILISTQIQTQNRLTSDLSLQSTSDLSIILKNLTDKRWQLTNELEEAVVIRDTYQDDYKGDAELLASFASELQRLQLITGSSAVHGPGIRVDVDGDILAADLMMLVNELWSAGAEAVAVNDTRVTDTSGFGYLEEHGRTYLTCGGEILQKPIQVRAIGDGATLEKSLTMPGGISDNLGLYQIYLRIRLEEDIQLNALPDPPQLRYGKVPEK